MRSIVNKTTIEIIVDGTVNVFEFTIHDDIGKSTASLNGVLLNNRYSGSYFMSEVDKLASKIVDLACIVSNGDYGNTTGWKNLLNLPEDRPAKKEDTECS